MGCDRSFDENLSQKYRALLESIYNEVHGEATSRTDFLHECCQRQDVA